jgi:hypothetical protein
MYAVKGMVRPDRQVCVKEIVNDIEISIGFDDSCGALQNMSRADIRLFDQDDNDITSEYSTDVIVGTIENMIAVYEWVKNRS